MNGWIFLGGDTYVKPIDWEELFTVSLSPDKQSYECRIRNIDGSSRLIGTGSTPRRAAQLTLEWKPEPRKAHLK